MTPPRRTPPRRTIALPLAIPREDVLHFLGYPPDANPPARIESRLSAAIATARRLADARGAFVAHPPARAAEAGLEPLDAAALVVGLVTIGGRLERHASELMARGASTDALLLDAAGSAAAEEAADRIGAIVSGDEAGAARHVSCRISPGYGGWPLHSQEKLFALLPHRAVGVTLLPSMLMVPRKSVSFAMWLGADARPLAGLSGCARCALEHCRYRRIAT